MFANFFYFPNKDVSKRTLQLNFKIIKFILEFVIMFCKQRTFCFFISTSKGRNQLEIIR